MAELDVRRIYARAPIKRWLRPCSVSVLLAASLTVLAGQSIANDACRISADTNEYSKRKAMAIMLMQYGELVVRATGGKIRCEEEAENRRQVCVVDGAGELLIEGRDRAPQIIKLVSDGLHQVHIYDAGDVSCGLQSQFD